MAYSRLAAIARRSYFDPEEDDHNADNETAELFAASNQGVRAASGKGGQLNGNGAPSDTLFQQVRLGAAGGLPSTPSSGQNGPAQGTRPKTTAGFTEGGEGGGQVKKGDKEPDEYGDAGIHQAVPITGLLHTTPQAEGETSKGQVSTPKADVAGLTVTEAAGGTHRADKTLGQHPGTRGGRRSLSSSCKTDVDGASKAEAETDQRSGDISPLGLPATVRPSSSQQRLFTMDDFADRPLSRGGGSSTRRLSPYREPQAGGQQPHLSASGSSKQRIREGTGQSKTQGEDKGTHRSATDTSASGLLEDQGTCNRPRIAGRRHDEPQAQHDRQGSSMSSQPSQGDVSGEGGQRPSNTEDVSAPSVAEGVIGKTMNQAPLVSRQEEHKTLSAANGQSSRQDPALEAGPLKTEAGAAPKLEAASTSATHHQVSGDEVGIAVDKQPSAAVAEQAPLSTVPGMTAGRAVNEAGQDAMAAKAGPSQPQSSTLSSTLTASRVHPPTHPSVQQQEAIDVATKANGAANPLQVVEPERTREKIFEKEPDARRASVDVAASTKASEQPGSHFRPPSIQTAAEEKPLKAVCGATASATCGAKAGRGSVAAHDTGDTLESTVIPITTSKSPVVGQCKGMPGGRGRDQPSDAYALVPINVEDGDAYQYQAPNFILVGEPHSQFDHSIQAEGEGDDRAVKDYELIGQEPMMTVTSQKSLFELLQKHTEAEAAAQRRLHEEEQALQQQEWDRQQQSEEQAYAGSNTGTWDDRLHYGADPSQNAEGQSGSEHQWQQSSQGGGDACTECLNHQEDLPAAHYAAAVGHFACLQALCTQDAYSLMSFDGANRSTLFYASANERTDCCEFLIDWYSPLINLADTNGDTPLHAAASSGSETCLYLLLHKGKALMDTQNRMGMTPPHLAKNASILRMLFEAGAQMAVQDRHGRTPLYLACAMNRTECAAYLCEIADLDQLALADRRGDTPLHAAAFHGNNECLLLLLQFGAPPTTPNIKGLTAIDLARNKGHTPCLKVLQEYHLHHSTNFDSVLFLASVEGHNAVKQQQEGETIKAQTSEHQALQSKKSICLKHYKEWLAYEYDDGRTFWYNSRTGTSQWEQPPELVMSPTAHRQLSSKDPSTVTKLKEVGDWIKYSNTKTQSFYYNQQSGDFQWTQPPEFGHATSSSTSTTDGTQATAQEVRGWQVYRDPSTSKTFYYNPVTQVSSWEPPPDGEVGGAWVPEQEEEAKQVNEMSDLGL